MLHRAYVKNARPTTMARLRLYHSFGEGWWNPVDLGLSVKVVQLGMSAVFSVEEYGGHNIIGRNPDGKHSSTAPVRVLTQEVKLGGNGIRYFARVKMGRVQSANAY